MISPLNGRHSSMEAADSPWGVIMRTLVLFLTHLVSQVVLLLMNRTTILRHSEFMRALRRRPADQGLITVCNHCSTIDDPMVLSAVTPLWFTLGEAMHGGSRWSLCDRKTCYSTPFLGQFFRTGKSLPTDRGAGVDQPVLRTAVDRLQRGDWVHLFPEGKVNYTGRLIAFRWGIGKIISDVVRHGNRPPLVLPMYHSGIMKVLPNKHMIPGTGHHVTVQVGSPVDLSDLLDRCRAAETLKQQQQVWIAITSKVEQALKELEDAAGTC